MSPVTVADPAAIDPETETAGVAADIVIVNALVLAVATGYCLLG